MRRKRGKSPFAWSPTAAMALVLGIALQAGGLPFLWVGIGAASLLGFVLHLSRHVGIWHRLVPRVTLIALLIPVGYVRHAERSHWVDPLAPALHRTVVLEGQSDGSLLYVRGVRSVVAVRPTGTMPRGFVRVHGTLTPAEGRRNPGGFDERAWLRRRGGSTILRNVTVLQADTDEAGLRGRLRAAISANLSPTAGQLMRALVLGEREGAGELRDTFARAGFAHLLALSGLHLGVLAAVVGTLLRNFGRRRGIWVAVAAIAFTLWIGPTPSLVRAAIMIAVVSLTHALARQPPSPLEALALAAVATLSLRPDWLHDLSFQLSYLALLGILAWGVPLAKRWQPLRPPSPTWRQHVIWTARNMLVSGFAVSSSAWLAGLPWVIDAFGEVALAGIVLNLVAVPLTTVLLPLGLMSGIAGLVHPSLAAGVNLFTQPVAQMLLTLADVGANLPSLTWAGISGVGKTLFVLTTFPWAWTLRYRFAAWRAALVTTVALLASVLLMAAGPDVLDRPELIALDVGQGDAILLRFPTGDAVLIDGGGSPFSDYDVGASIVVPALRALGVHRLTWVFSTHADMDHAEGLPSVLRRLEVGALGYGVAQPGRPSWDRLLATAVAEGVPMVELRRGQTLTFGQAQMHVLHPSGRPLPGHEEDANADSLAFRIDWRGAPWLLLLGDNPIEVDLTLAVPPLPVVMASHHGSADGTSASLLRATQPETVIISVGWNRYGHPSQALLQRVQEVGAEVLRTDQRGAIRVQPAW